MREAFRLHLEREGLIPAGATVLAAYSGGPDSTCLLHLLSSLGVPVVAAHLNHSQRPEGDEEAERCKAFCDEIGAPIVVGKADVPRIARDMKIGLEQAGREARYAFFAQAAGQTDCSLIATGHTQDDLLETLILNLARGAGLSGMAGIPARRQGIIRPLLPFSRKECQAYCQEHGLWTHDDPANTDISFARSRVRLRVVPELEAIHPGVRSAATRLSRLAEEEDRFLNGMAAAALEKAEIPLNGPLRFLTLDCEAAFARAELACLPVPLLRRGLRLAVEALGGALDYDQTQSALEGVLGEGAGSVTAEGGKVILTWGGDKVEAAVAQPDEPFRFGLTVPGETISDEFGWTLEARVGPDFDHQTPRGSLVAVLDLAQVKGALYFRSAQPGDTMKPLGLDGTRKLSDILNSTGLTRAARRRLPIICDLAGPIWAPSGPLADRVKVTHETQRRLQITLRATGD